MFEILHEWNKNGSLLPPCFKANFTVVSMEELLDDTGNPGDLLLKKLQQWQWGRGECNSSLWIDMCIPSIFCSEDKFWTT